ncbi:MAG: hypothetical protein V9E98_08700 [Candidatus Nanopelagicales bacterium]
MSGGQGMLPHISEPAQVFDDTSRYLDRFGWLLTLVCGTIVVASLVHVPHEQGGIENYGAMLLAAVGYLALLLAIHACGVTRRYRRIAEAVITVLVLVQVGGGVYAIVQGDQVAVDVRFPPVGALLFSLLSLGLVIRRLLNHRDVTAATLMGAITAYMLIPLTFFNLYLTIDSLSPGPFFAKPEPSSQFMFFSLTAVSTLGSPLEPSSDLGRLLVAGEAIVGQLYLVVFVAMIVGLMASRWKGRAASDDGEAEPS